MEAAKNLGVRLSTLTRWEAQFRSSGGDIPVRGSGNYSSDEAKEIARFKRELRDARDTLDVLKKSHQHSGEKLTETIYTGVAAKVEAAKITGHHVSTSGMLKFLGVSRSGYRSFLNRTVSATKQRQNDMKKKIQVIYDASKQNYGAPKITHELR